MPSLRPCLRGQVLGLRRPASTCPSTCGRAQRRRRCRRRRRRRAAIVMLPLVATPVAGILRRVGRQGRACLVCLQGLACRVFLQGLVCQLCLRGLACRVALAAAAPRRIGSARRWVQAALTDIAPQGLTVVVTGMRHLVVRAAARPRIVRRAARATRRRVVLRAVLPAVRLVRGRARSGSAAQRWGAAASGTGALDRRPRRAA